MTYLNRDMDGGPFLVYFLPILGGQKAAVSDSVEGWCAAGNLRASRVSISMDDRTDGQTDDGMDDRTDSGKASFLIPTSFNVCNNYAKTGRSRPPTFYR
jgi:hypothetical protein